MRQFNVFRGTSGWLSMWERTIRFRSMRNKQEVERRVKILDFWKKHGEKATKDAFGVSRRTLYRWQSTLDQAQGKLDSLDSKSRATPGRRKRMILPDVESFIIRERETHPRLGKKKLRVLLEEAGFKLSESDVGRGGGDLKTRGLLSA